MFGVLCATTLRLSPHQVRLGEVVEVSIYSVDSLEQQPAMTLIVVAAIIIHHMNPSSRFRSGASAVHVKQKFERELPFCCEQARTWRSWFVVVVGPCSCTSAAPQVFSALRATPSM